jgi:CRISPR type III-associated protein (TIGR04423 family)
MFNKININSLPKGNFEGYFWYSNAENPLIQTSGPIDVDIFKDLPFVIEANFYDKALQISVSVRHSEGEYHITQYNLAQPTEGLELDEVYYEGHDLKGHNYLMKEAWQPVSDELLAGMETLQPAWAAFAGFVHPQSKVQ